MKTFEVLKVLKSSIELNNELIELVEECLKEIFKDKSSVVIGMFLDDIDMINYNGCLQSLECYKNSMKE